VTSSAPVATFLLANAGGAIALLHGIRGVNRVVAELDEDPDPLYPATLLAFGHGFADWKVTGWAAVHRAARDHDSQHPLTVLGRGATTQPRSSKERTSTRRTRPR
jgi:hypothetical protein